MNKLHVSVGIGFAVAASTSVFGYETSTHQLLSGLAVDGSVIYKDSDFMNRLGLPPLESATFPTYVVGGGIGPRKTVYEAIRYGSRFEDEVDPLVSQYHFFDPQYQNGVGRGIQWYGLTGEPSPDWITETRKTFPDQRYSFRAADTAYFNGLTATQLVDRDNSMGLMFQSLGHVIHHIQDMAQPQHTRNEAHIHDSGIELLDWAYNASAAYELYTQSKVDSRIGQIVASGVVYRVPEFARVWDYWSGPTTGKYVGMADFTSKNFVRMTSGYKSTLVNGVAKVENATPQFPLPNGLNKDNSAKFVDARLCTVTGSETGKVYNTAARFVVGKVYDEHYGASFPEQLLAVETSLTHVNGGGVQRNYNGMAHCIWEADYNILFPRAVAFSTGLVNHFFRGKLAVTRVDKTHWQIKNTSTFPMYGTYYFLREDLDGDRSYVNSNFLLNLEGGSSTVVSVPEQPADTRKLVVAFRGKIGTEDGRVAGVVVPYSSADASCGTTIAAQGRSEGLAGAPMDLGTKSGKVSVQFQAYDIPDGLTIKGKDSGKILVSSNGPVSYLHDYSFNFDGSEANRKIAVYVQGSDNPETYWTVAVSCPGEAVKPVYSTRNVFIGPMDGNCQPMWAISVDGGPILRGQTFNIPMMTGPGTHLITYNRDGDGSCGQFSIWPSDLIYTDGAGNHRFNWPGVPGNPYWEITPTIVK